MNPEQFRKMAEEFYLYAGKETTYMAYSPATGTMRRFKGPLLGIGVEENIYTVILGEGGHRVAIYFANVSLPKIN